MTKSDAMQPSVEADIEDNRLAIGDPGQTVLSKSRKSKEVISVVNWWMPDCTRIIF